MPGPHVDLKLMQCFPDVGGVDAWYGGFWQDRCQWFTGYHQPGAKGLAGLIEWSCPAPNWDLIGYELWESRRKGDTLIEAYYNDPNPSTTAAGKYRQSTGHWHMRFWPNGDERDRQWFPNALEEDLGYLKGGITGTKGGGITKGKGMAKGNKGMAKGNVFPKSGKDKGKGKGTAKGNTLPKGSKGNEGMAKGNTFPKSGKDKGKGKGTAKGNTLPKGSKGKGMAMAKWGRPDALEEAQMLVLNSDASGKGKQGDAPKGKGFGKYPNGKPAPGKVPAGGEGLAPAEAQG